MIALVRHVGIPCRYVSGYLYHGEENSDRSTADATHAWIEAFLPQVGWVGFDPTNNLLAQNRYIRTALGQGLCRRAADARHLSREQRQRALCGGKGVEICRFAAAGSGYAGTGRLVYPGRTCPGTSDRRRPTLLHLQQMQQQQQ